MTKDFKKLEWRCFVHFVALKRNPLLNKMYKDSFSLQCTNKLKEHSASTVSIYTHVASVQSCVVLRISIWLLVCFFEVKDYETFT